MSNKKIQAILNDALEEEIPSSQVNLWPAVKADLVAGKYPQEQQGHKMNTTNSRRIPQYALAVLLLLALLVVFLATPPGRSFAKSILELFTRVESKEFPLDESFTAPFASDQVSPTTLPPSPLISVLEAEAQVGFNLAEIPFVPQGFEFLGVRLYGQFASFDYLTEGYGHLLINQSQEGFYQSDWDNVPSDEIMPVKIGELDGEIAQGSFLKYPGETSAVWNPDASFTRLRWVNKGVWSEIALYGDAHEYLDLAGLIELAESLTIQP